MLSLSEFKKSREIVLSLCNEGSARPEAIRRRAQKTIVSMKKKGTFDIDLILLIQLIGQMSDSDIESLRRTS